MAKSGPKPTPTKLRILTGNPQHRPINQREPKPPTTKPVPPEWLEPDELAIWNKGQRWMITIGLLTVADEMAFGMICELAARYLKTKKIIAAQTKLDPATAATIIQTSAGNSIQNPMIGALNVLRRDLMKALAEFGLTPSSRSQIGIEPDADADPIMRKYKLGA